MNIPDSGKLTVTALPQNLQLQLWQPAVELHQALEARIALPVDLALTDNRRAIFSARIQDGRCRVRIHHMFTEADGPTLGAVIALAAPTSTASRVRWARAHIHAFSVRHRDKLRTRTPTQRRTRLKTQGRSHDLAVLLSGVLSERVAGQRPPIDITWGRWGRSRGGRRRNIRLGSYDPRSTLIRIHPTLDRPGVPSWVVRFVIFHEVLHHLEPIQLRGGRHIHHSPAFRQREAAHPDYDRFHLWLNEHLPTLLDRDRPHSQHGTSTT